MKKIVFAVLLIVLIGCGTKKQIPDVSKVQVTLSTQHFEQDFFAMDTTQIDTSIQQLFNKYPVFMVDFLQNILASNPQPDSIMKNVKLFTNRLMNCYPNYRMTRTHTPARLLKRWMTQVLKLKRRNRYRNYSRP